MPARLSAIVPAILALACAFALAEEAAPPKPDDKKAEEEALKAKIVEILAKVKGSYASELPLDDWNRIRDGAEADLLALGEKAIPLLLPYMDSQALKEVLGKTDTEFSGRVKGVVLRLGWISPEMEAELKELLEKLAKKEIVLREDGTRFRELGAYAARALDAELRKNPNQPVREKICEILGDMGQSGVFAAIDPLLFAGCDPEAGVRLQAFNAIAAAAYVYDDDQGDKHWKALDEVFAKLKAYEMFVSHLAQDPDPRVRLRAATVLGRMEVPHSAEALMSVLSSEKEDNVKSEAVWALEMISGIEGKSTDEWKARVARVGEWWGKKKDSLPKQIKPDKPKIREKPKDAKEEKK